jgi:hypothetical protein
VQNQLQQQQLQQQQMQELQYLQMMPSNQLQRKQHIQQLQQQLEAAQVAYQEQYGSMDLQLISHSSQHSHPVSFAEGFSRSLENGLHHHHTYENIPALQTPEVTRLRGGAFPSLPCTPQSTRAALADMRRRSSTVAAVGHTSQPVTPVTRAKSTATDTRPKERLKEDDCPLHSSRSLVVDEILSKNISLPLLTALCNDSSLMSATCSCSGTPMPSATSPGKRFSYAQPPSVHRLLEPGTMTRPMSWHSDHLSLEQMLRQAPQEA